MRCGKEPSEKRGGRKQEEGTEDRMNTEPKRTISFSPPDMSELEINEVADCLRSGWITTGPRTKKLEKELKEYVGADGLVCLNSATASEELSLRMRPLYICLTYVIRDQSRRNAAEADFFCHIRQTYVLYTSYINYIHRLPGTFFMTDGASS